MPTPQINIRVPTEHHDLMRLIASAVKRNPSIVAALRAVCQDGESSFALAITPESSPESSLRIDALDDRIAALEEKEPRMAKIDALEVRMAALEERMDGIDRTAAPRQPRPPAEGKRRPKTDITPELHRRIHELRAEGKTHRAIADELGISNGVVHDRLNKPLPD
jgi:DNA-binding NarL/FixJ family response regulator